MCEEEKKPENAGENESGRKDKELMLLVAPVEKCAPCKWWIVLAFMVLLCFATIAVFAFCIAFCKVESAKKLVAIGIGAATLTAWVICLSIVCVKLARKKNCCKQSCKNGALNELLKAYREIFK